MAFPVIEGDESSSGSGIFVAGTTISIDLPVDTAENDLLLAIITTDGNPTITPPSGWTSYPQAVASGTVNCQIFSLVASASEPASYVFTLSASVTRIGIIERISNASSAIVYASDTHSASTITIAPSVVSPDEEFVIFRIVFADGNALSAEPSGYTNIVSTASASFSALYLWKQQTGIGATGTENFTHTSAIGGAYTIVVTSAAASPVLPFEEKTIVTASSAYVTFTSSGERKVTASGTYVSAIVIGERKVTAGSAYINSIVVGERVVTDGGVYVYMVNPSAYLSEYCEDCE